MTDKVDTPRVPFREKLEALYTFAAYRSSFATRIILSIFAAMLGATTLGKISLSGASDRLLRVLRHSHLRVCTDAFAPEAPPSFLIPIIKISQGRMGPGEACGVGQTLVSTYEFIGVPFTLEWLVLVTVELFGCEHEFVGSPAPHRSCYSCPV